jgi:hypothetical protein
VSDGYVEVDKDEDHTMNSLKAQEALRVAEELAKQAKSGVDLHNAFFGIGGKFGELFPTRAEREAFLKTPEYQEIVRLRAALNQSAKVASSPN